jgi:Icc-related predicted phosphoesterase
MFTGGGQRLVFLFIFALTVAVIFLCINQFYKPYVHDVRVVWASHTHMYVAWHCAGCDENKMAIFVDYVRYNVTKTRGTLISPFYEYQSGLFRVEPEIYPSVVLACWSMYACDRIDVTLSLHGMKMVISGDIGRGKIQHSVLGAMASHSPDLIFLAGDIVYQEGLGQHEWYKFTEELQSVVPNNIPVMVSRGNHDPFYMMKNAFSMPWRSETSTSYVFHVKHVAFIVLSYSPKMTVEYMDDEITFLYDSLNSLNRTDYPNVVIVDHYPYTTSAGPDHDMRTTEVGRRYLEYVDALCDLHEVTMTLHGHAHLTEVRKDRRMMSVTAGGSMFRYSGKTKKLNTNDVLFLDERTHCIVVIEFFTGKRFSIDIFTRTNDLVARFLSI